MGYNRRKVLAAVGGVAYSGLTGCLSGESAGRSGFEAQISFPVMHDLGENVVPEDAEANSLVPVGQHGHGWEPSPDVQREVSSSDAFVYVFEGFQPWADDMVTNVRRDHPDVAIVEAGEGVDMLEVGEYGHGDEGENDGHHEEEGGHHHDEGENGHSDDHEEEGNDHHGDHHEDEHHEGEEEDEHEEDGGHDHDHGGVDPHFWLDPLRAKTAVENVAQGLADADENNEGYEENSEEYRSELDTLHQEFEESLSGASQDTILVAGHNAFGYLGARYGFEVVTLTGVSPDEQPSAGDIDHAQRLIEDEGIEYVLSPVFESDTAAKSLVNDTTADGVLPITAFPAFRQEWRDKGWGYVEVMRNVNLPSLEKALEV